MSAHEIVWSFDQDYMSGKAARDLRRFAALLDAIKEVTR